MQLSIILPALNEAARVEAALARLAAQAPGAERILVDGGSTDGTPLLARRLGGPGLTVLEGERGRARQMNRGAAAARGDWLLFLHVDTRLPNGFAAEPGRAAARGCGAGAFRLRIAGRHPLLPLLAWGANLRTAWRGIALGDQALFLRRGVFQALGGFPDLPLMEDYALALRLRAAGERLYLSPLAAETSGRRWDGAGFWRTWWTMRRAYWGFDRGAPVAALAARYPDVR
jgi:rSAM/selenodomain-associated transferase 2